MTFAWNLDADTHSHFREFLDVFIKKREVSKDFKVFVMEPSMRMYLSKRGNAVGAPRPEAPDGGWGPGGLVGSLFNELRISLPNRVLGGGIEGRPIYAYTFPHLSTPVLIEGLHPPIISHEMYEELGGKGDLGYWWGWCVRRTNPE
tara:strand:+ start:58 stop:495 length:438 start_codon:yes stop_codon:yes gene_type:complete